MTKIDAVRKVLEANGGSATWPEIYKNITRYYKTAKTSKYWQEGIRGVVYREERCKENFKVKNGIVSLID